MKYFMKWLSVFHPLLFAVFFILALYSTNVNEVSPSDIIIPLFSAVGFALLVLLLALLLIGLIRRLSQPHYSSQQYQIWDLNKAAIVASIFIILFFTFGHALRAIGGWDDTHRTVGIEVYWYALSILWFALLASLAYFIVRTSRALSKLTVLLSIVAFSLFVVPTINIVINDNSAAQQDTDIEENAVGLVKPDPLPDIYYIIFDRYASARTLEEAYDFDNIKFLNYLSDKGFYVANNSVSNYPSTDRSLISSLNMDFLQNDTAESPIGGNILDYRVWHYLKANGYTFIHFGSWYEATRENPFADMNVNYHSIPEFSLFLFQTTWAYPYCLKLDIVDQWQVSQYNRVLYKFDKLAEIPDMEEPTFVFAHMLIPHGPYVFNSDNSLVTLAESRGRSEDVRYVNQLIACNNMLTVLIDEILSKSDIPPIIILTADEGPWPGTEQNWGARKLSVGYEGATDEELRIKYGILNAYYLPNVDKDILYPSITPVNSFRLVFNLYFDADFELLPDKRYAPYKDEPYVYFEVTDKVGYD